MSAKMSTKILIVDDETEIAQILEEYLENEGYKSSLASSGSEALDQLEKDKDYSVVLLDLNMPKIDGLTVLKHIRELYSDTAVIMMTGHGNEELAVECMRNGAEDYITKPFGLLDVLHRIERSSTHRQERLEKHQLQKEKEDFILMLSHDMKNPLTAAIGSIDIIREGCLGEVNEEQGEYLQSAIDSCNEVVVMIDNLLDIRKFEAGKDQLVIRYYNANELVEKIVSQFARLARHDGIELSVDVMPDASEILVDRNAFIRVLGNLITNALKFTLEGGKISVSSRHLTGEEIRTRTIPAYVPVPRDFLEAGHFNLFTVTDTGNGIPADELEPIFDRFTQFSRKSGRERGGAGLGLAYCKMAIEIFQGLIWAESENGQGSTFVILLPCSSKSGSGN
jgi:signal transduction histidine kinase